MKKTGKKEKPTPSPDPKQSARRLTHNDVHYVVGFLYVVTNKVAVVLGDRVLDSATNTERDVDIFVAGDWGIGVEVKDEGRPLDVSLVEGICAKFVDMEAIRTRAIVSSSGYTKPALLKAQRYGVKCLRLIKGSLPPMFRGADFSKLNHLTLRDSHWLAPPRVSVVTASGTTHDDAPLTSTTTERTPSAKNVSSLGDLVAKLPAKVEDAEGSLELTCKIDYPLNVEVGGVSESVVEIKAAGIIAVSHSQTPLLGTTYLANEKDEVEAVTVLFEYAGGLLAAASDVEGRISITRLPDEVLAKRPNRHPLDWKYGDGGA